jgi:hypothetical protein
MPLLEIKREDPKPRLVKMGQADKVIAPDDTLSTMVASESVLAQEWDTPEEDEAWKELAIPRRAPCQTETEQRETKENGKGKRSRQRRNEDDPQR